MNGPKTLYIYCGDKDKSLPDGDRAQLFIYCMGLGRLLGEGAVSLNDQDALNQIATDLRHEYSNYIFSLNKVFLQAGAVYKKRLSLYFLTDLACKRTEIFSTYSDICNLLLVKQAVEREGIERIVLDGCRQELTGLFNSAFPGLQLEQSGTRPPRRFSLLKATAKNLVYYWTLLAGQLLSFNLGSAGKSQKQPGGMAYLTRYPLHLNDDLYEDKYVDRVGDHDAYLVHLFTDGLHQKLSLGQYLAYRKRLAGRKNVFVLDRYLSIKDVVIGFVRGIGVLAKLNTLPAGLPLFRGLDFTPHLRSELGLAMMRIPRLVAWEKAFVRAIDDMGVEGLTYYLHEYPYGRFFTFVTRMHALPVQLVGYQHGPASKRKLVYYCAKGELARGADMLNSFPEPDLVLAEDALSRQIYQEAGYSNVQLMEKIHRLHYLAGVDRSRRKDRFELITPGLHDGRFLMLKLAERIEQNLDTTFVLKPHPRANNDYIEEYRELKNLVVEPGDIAGLLGQASRVFATYSSVGIEAKILGIETEIIEVPGRINESPLLDAEFEAALEAVRF